MKVSALSGSCVTAKTSGSIIKVRSRGVYSRMYCDKYKSSKLQMSTLAYSYVLLHKFNSFPTSTSVNVYEVSKILIGA